MEHGDPQADLLADWQPSDAAPPVLTPWSRRQIRGTLTVLAIVLTLVASMTFAGYAVVVGVPVELLAVGCAVAVVTLTRRGTRSRLWAWVLLAFTLIPVGLTTAYLVGIY
jgi:hypothetical protein